MLQIRYMLKAARLEQTYGKDRGDEPHFFSEKPIKEDSEEDLGPTKIEKDSFLIKVGFGALEEGGPLQMIVEDSPKGATWYKKLPDGTLVYLVPPKPKENPLEKAAHSRRTQFHPEKPTLKEYPLARQLNQR